MRHDVRFGSDPSFRSMRRKSKEKGQMKEKEQQMMPALVKTVVLPFEEDAEGIHAMVDGRRASLSGYSDKTVMEGQRWKCMIDRKNPYRPEIIPLELVSEKPEEKEIPVEIPKAEENVKVVKAPGRSEDVERLEAENKRLREENADLRRNLRVFEEYSVKCVEKDGIIKGQKRTINSLTEQVKVLDWKASDMNVADLEHRIEMLEDGIESREREIAMLREKIRSLGADDLKFVPRLPPVMKAIKNGSTLRFKDSVEDGRYRVYVNPRSHRLLIVPDANGAVCCTEGEMRLSCIDSVIIRGEAGPRKVAIDAVGDGWEVILA